MYGASGTYMIGDFNGKVFTPECGKHYYTTGSAYAGQTFNNIPNSDGRRIQISWGRITSKNMPFNMLMLLPTELKLISTNNGVRLFSTPIDETNLLTDNCNKWENLNVEEADKNLNIDDFSGKANSCLKVAAGGRLVISGGLNDSEKVIFTSIDDNSSFSDNLFSSLAPPLLISAYFSISSFTFSL